jgi:hypothetical protein
MTRPGLVLAGAILTLSSVGETLAADPPLPLTVADLTGPRSLAIAGGVGVATGTEALFVNPAALAARKRFALDGLYLWDARPGLQSPASHAQYFGGAVADSVSAPLAAGVSFLRAMKGPQTGNIISLGLAGPLTEGLFLGFTGKYYSLSGAGALGVESVRSSLNVDAGLFWQLTRHLSLGGAAYNLVGNSKDFSMPKGYGAGIALGSDTSLQVTGDWHMDAEACFTPGGQAAFCPPKGTASDLKKRSASKYGGGVEYLVDNLVPVRGGFQVDDVAKTKWWSAGIGLVTSQAAVDVGYRQSLDKTSARTIMVAVRGFLPNE